MITALRELSPSETEALRNAIIAVARFGIRLQPDAATPHQVFRGSADDVELACVQFLVRKGYAVELPGVWETPTALCRRIGLKKRSFNRRLKRTKFMPQADIERGPTGRILRIRSNAIFDRWLLQGRTSGQLFLHLATDRAT